ncbi:MAG: ABC transporter permease subunit [Fuerstiella sp.]|nr:ABC transporter permease subunit [Fuerstiella sp.]MCP4788011.1 ABC transporter permease subunit [Fuerstiella sp.]MCP4855998.1 ABC transporter permease subunit [Fuerstiella sp.]
MQEIDALDDKPTLNTGYKAAGVVAPVAVAVVVVAVWQAFVWVSDVSPLVLPSPLQICSALARESGDLVDAAWCTACAALTGLAASTLLGVLTAFAFSQSRIVRRTFYPYAILLQTVPIIAIAPIIVISFGRGFHSVALVALVISLFPIITNTTTGLLQVDAGHQDLFELHSATWWQTLWKLRLPSSLPYLISGVRIAGGAAIVGAIVGEFFVGSSQPGLGSMIQKKAAGIAMDELFATVFVSTLLGVIVFGTITLAGEWILKRFFGMSLSGVR